MGGSGTVLLYKEVWSGTMLESQGTVHYGDGQTGG